MAVMFMVVLAVVIDSRRSYGVVVDDHRGSQMTVAVMRIIKRCSDDCCG